MSPSSIQDNAAYQYTFIYVVSPSFSFFFFLTAFSIISTPNSVGNLEDCRNLFSQRLSNQSCAPGNVWGVFVICQTGRKV